MAVPIDSILSILVQQGATELRLGTNRAPRMFARGTQKKLAIPETSDEMVRHLLGTLLDAGREASLGEVGRVEFSYDAPSLGVFHVTLTTRAAEPGFDGIFTRASGNAAAAVKSVAVAASPALPPAPSQEPPPKVAPTTLPSNIAAPAAPAAGAVSPAVAAPAMLLVAPVVVVAQGALAGLLERAVSLRASDVHLLNGEVPSVRVDGKLAELEGEPPADPARLLEGVLGPAEYARLGALASVDLAVEVAGAGRFRVNVYRAANGLAAAIRLLARGAPSLASLGLPYPLDELADIPHGLVIVCGPTGSGKSTTLAALAQETLRRRRALVISLEDPIEYVLGAGSGLVRQRQIGRDVHDFVQGLRDALREDPDVLLIGEMRDAESITLALTAAETGHLVLTSLHSRSAASAVERIVDAYPPGRQQQVRGQLADALRAVVSQRLLPRKNGNGRVVALEIMRGNHSVAAMLREGKTAQLPTAIQSSKKEGMVALERCLADLVRAGQITTDAARAVVNDPAVFELFMRGS